MIKKDNPIPSKPQTPKEPLTPITESVDPTRIKLPPKPGNK